MSKEWKNPDTAKKKLDDAKKIRDTIKKYDSIVLYDLETSGLKKKEDKILQFSAVRFQLPAWNVLDSIDLYIKCPFSVNGTVASEVNHITDELLAEKGVEEDEALSRIQDFMRADDLIGGYNSQRFDDKFMEVLCSDHGKKFAYADNIDVYKLAKYLIPEEQVMYPDKYGKTKPSYTLAHVSEYCRLEEKIQFHSAIEDVKATGYVCKKLLEMVKEKENEKEEKAESKDAEKQSPTVYSFGCFHPSEAMKRVYFQTSQGKVYYDVGKKIWAVKNGSIESFDMQRIVSQVFNMLDISSESEIYPAAEKMEKIRKAKKLLGLSTYTAVDLDQAYNEALNRIEEVSDWRYETRKKEIESAYRTLQKTLKKAS